MAKGSSVCAAPRLFCMIPPPPIVRPLGSVSLVGSSCVVDKILFFVTSGGFLTGGDSRSKLNVRGKGPTAVITDLGILTPDPSTKELVLTSVHPGVDPQKAVDETGWALKVAPSLKTTPPPTEQELTVLRDLQARTARAHAGQA